MSRRARIAVYGSSTAREGDATYSMAFELGEALARGGADVVTGGYSGVMEACSRGAHEAGGHVVGVTVELFESRSPTNRWVKERVHTSHLYDRLQHLIEHSDGFVVTPGSLGTLTELYLTWTLLSVSARPPAPLVLLGPRWPAVLEAHRGEGAVPEALYRHVQLTADPGEAAKLVLAGVAVVPEAP